MITGELRAKIDRIWDDCWSGGISNPLSVIEQITFLLFIKRLDEIHTNREFKANEEKKPFDNPVFPLERQNLRWSKFKDMEAGEMYENMVANVFPFIKNLKSELNGSYSHFMKDAVFIIPTPQLLELVVTKLSEIPMERRDTKGDLYEYLLSRIATAGQNGQFRTPRHIISMMVKLVKPMPRDIICDPASGTSGFLVAAAEYLQENHKDLFLDEKQRKHFNHGMFYGNDFDLTMQRIGTMYLLLHGIENPNLTGLDALSDRNSGNRGNYSVVLANPPFKGSLDYGSVSKDLLQTVKTKKTELLFLALFTKMDKRTGHFETDLHCFSLYVDLRKISYQLKKIFFLSRMEV